MSELEIMLAESAGRIFANEVTVAQIELMESGQWSTELWAQLEDSGLTRVLVTESDEGASASWSEALPVLLAASKNLTPVAFVETVLAGWILSQLGIAVPRGAMCLALPKGEVEFASHGAGYFTGKVSAPWGRCIKHVLVAVRNESDDSPVWLLLPSEGVQVEQGTNAAAEPRDTLVFEGTPVVAQCRGYGGDPKLLGALLTSIQISGVLERILNQSVQYASDRVQFGKPIGKFQAIQQQLSLMANHVVAARMAVATACDAMESPNWERQAMIAKVVCGQAASVVAGIAHQVHGAIGFTYEHTLHFATRRLWSWRAEFGGDSEWAEKLGREAIARGGKDLWADLTIYH